MSFLHRYSIRHPLTVVTIAALAVTAAGVGAVRLKLRTDGYALVPADRPEIEVDRRVRAEFNTEDLIVVVIRSNHNEGIFNVETLRLIEELTVEIQTLEGLRPYDVSSLYTEHSHRVRQGTLDFRRFLDPLPTTPEQLATLRSDLARIGLYTGTIVSLDGTAASILVGVPSGLDRTEFYRKVKSVIAAHQPRREDVDVIGPVVAEALLGTHILEDLGVPHDFLGLTPAEIAPETADPGHRLLYDLRLIISRRIGLLPIAIAMMALVFLLSFRSLFAAMLPLLEIGACLIAIFGLMGWLGVPVYLTIAVMPVILAAVGVTDEIHIFNRCRQLVGDAPDRGHVEALLEAMDDMHRPVIKTSVTSAVGFLSFATSSLAPVRAFGIFTAAGIIFCMVWSLSVIPAILALVDRKRFAGWRRAGGAQRRFGSSALASMAAAIGRGRYVLVVAGILILFAVPDGLRRITIQDSWIDSFAPESRFHRATRFFNQQFLGVHVLLVCVQTEGGVVRGNVPLTAVAHQQVRLPGNLIEEPDEILGQTIVLSIDGQGSDVPSDGQSGRSMRPWQARIESVTREGPDLVVATERRRGSALIGVQGREGDSVSFEIRVQPLTDPKVVRLIEELESFIEGQSAHTVGGVIGAAAYMATTNLMASGLREEARCIPDDPERIEWLWQQYQRIRGEPRLRQAVSPDYTQALVTAFLKDANFVDVALLMQAIRDYESKNLRPAGLSLEFAGDVAVSQTLIDAIVQTQIRSLGGSLIGILAVTSLLGRSVRWGLLSTLPCTVSVLINLAVMGWTGIPLGVATSMFSSMTLGIGVDHAIHLIERYRLSRSTGAGSAEAMAEAMVISGPAVFIDAAAVALGFGVLILSQVPTNARLGALVVLSIGGCLTATVLLLPALLRLLPASSRRN